MWHANPNQSHTDTHTMSKQRSSGGMGCGGEGDSGDNRKQAYIKRTTACVQCLYAVDCVAWIAIFLFLYLSSFRTTGILTSISYIYEFSSFNFDFCVCVCGCVLASELFFSFLYWKFSAVGGNEFFPMISASLFYSLPCTGIQILVHGSTTPSQTLTNLLPLLFLCWHMSTNWPNLLTFIYLYAMSHVWESFVAKKSRCFRIFFDTYRLVCAIIYWPASLVLGAGFRVLSTNTISYNTKSILLLGTSTYVVRHSCSWKFPFVATLFAHSHNINDTKWPITSKCSAYTELHHILRRINVN